MMTLDFKSKMASNGVCNGSHARGEAADPEPKRPRRCEGEWSMVKATRQSRDCVNPVRSCEEKYFVEAMEKRDTSKSLIKLSIGETAGVSRYLGHWVRQSHPF